MPISEQVQGGQSRASKGETPAQPGETRVLGPDGLAKCSSGAYGGARIDAAHSAGPDEKPRGDRVRATRVPGLSSATWGQCVVVALDGLPPRVAGVCTVGWACP